MCGVPFPDGWNAKNQRIHRSTLRVPKTVYDSVEKSAMLPLLPSVYETSPNTFRTYEIAALPYVLYKSCRYSVPRDYAFKTVRFKVVSGKIHIYDDQLNYICSHNLSERKGSVNQLPEHRKQDSGDWIEIMERLRGKWNCYDFQHFINGVKKENPRHISKQLRAIEQFLDSENPDKSLVAQVMKECCQKYRYQFSQFKVVYSLCKSRPGTDHRRLPCPGSIRQCQLHGSFCLCKSLSGTHRKEGGCCSMNREILKSMDTGHIPVQRLTALLETFTLKHAARMLPDLLETADLQDSSCREFLLAVLETEVKGRNERRRKRNYSAAHFPPNIRPLEEFDPEELESGITHAQLSVLKELSWLDNCGNLVFAGPPGLGKTMVACGLGLQAVNSGYTVCFEKDDEPDPYPRYCRN